MHQGVVGSGQDQRQNALVLAPERKDQGNRLAHAHLRAGEHHQTARRGNHRILRHTERGRRTAARARQEQNRNLRVVGHLPRQDHRLQRPMGPLRVREAQTNPPANTDARGSAALCKGRRPRAACRDRWAALARIFHE